MSRGVFFDRDDTLIRCREVTPSGDLGNPELVELIDGAESACNILKQRNFALAVITNQGGVARGRYGTKDVEAVNERVNALLGGRVDAFRYCPYHPEGIVAEFTREHFWRKPNPGMILDAAEELDIELSESWLIGDSPRDIMAGRGAGCRTIMLVLPGQGAKPTAGADFVASSLVEAADLIAATEPGVQERASIKLSALSGAPLREARVRETVAATARAIAERNGVKLLELAVDDRTVTAALATSRLAAVGFAAELRRLTDDWYREKFGVAGLWGSPKQDGSS